MSTFTEQQTQVRMVELTRIRRITTQIEYKAGYRPRAEVDKADEFGRVYLQVECVRPDADTGIPDVGRGGKAYLSPHMTASEVVRRAFGLFLAYEEHECREFFRWNGARVFGPHISVEALAEVADRLDIRS